MSAEKDRLPLSAVIVSRNEAALLARCLPTVRFCEEIIVVDLDSRDETSEVAAAHGARVLRRPFADSVERVRASVVEEARHDWLLFTDPDEELPSELALQLAELLPSLAPDVALVYGPIQYYFGERPLRGTVWGGVTARRLLVCRSAVEISPTIYAGVVVRPGRRAISIPFSGDNAIAHHWVAGYRGFYEKHRRYVRVASEDRYRNGEITGYRMILGMPIRTFWESFVVKRGYRDGVTGLALSVLWAWYSTSSEIALKHRLDRVPAD